MKRIIYVTFAVLALSAMSCSQEKEITTTGTVPATILASELSVKTEAERYQDEKSGEYMYHINWSDGDKISVFNNLTATNNMFQTKTGGMTAFFSGEIPGESTATYAILPYDQKALISGNVVTTTIPSYQNGDFSNIVLAGNKTQEDENQNFKFKFEAVSGIVRFKLPADLTDIVAVDIIADLPIAGDVTIDWNSGTPVMKAKPNAQKSNLFNSVTIANADGTPLSTSKVYYAAVIPITKAGDQIESMGVTLRFMKENFNKGYKNAEVGKGEGSDIFAPNVVKNFGTFGKPHFINARGGVFTAGKDGHVVRFAQGNLQYRASDNIWRFAQEQWEALGDLGNTTLPAKSGSSDYGERATQPLWIDLFPWGHSGWTDPTGKTYPPYSCTNIPDDNCSNYNGTRSLTGAYAEGDFGVHNPISNAGNKKGIWRLPTKEELQYIIGYDNWAVDRRPAAKIKGEDSDGHKYEEDLRFMSCGVKIGGDVRYGVALFPDGFTWPDEISRPITKAYPYISIGARYAERQEYVYDVSEFVLLEEYGVIFLPCAGYRSSYNDPTTFVVNNFNLYGRYETSNGYEYDSQLAFYDANISFEHANVVGTGLGASVRLVMDVNASATLEEYNFNDSEIN